MTESTISAIAKNPLLSVTSPLGGGLVALFFWLYSQIGGIGLAIEALDRNQTDLSEKVAALSGKVEGIDHNRDAAIRADFEAFKAETSLRLAACEDAIEPQPPRRRR